MTVQVCPDRAAGLLSGIPGASGQVKRALARFAGAAWAHDDGASD
jgi:hypothetical protein